MSKLHSLPHEHEFEPQFGLPERLPAAEQLIWQGSPAWKPLARSVFHVNKVALYFALLLAWQLAGLAADNASPAALVRAAGWSLLPMLLALAALLLLAWLTARTTVYTLTDRRVVMRVGIVLTVTYNLPLRCIDRADLRAPAGGRHGDIALVLEPRTRIAWLHLWPHVRPWRVARPQPMLRALPDASTVAAQLAAAWTACNGQPARAQRPESTSAPGPSPRLAAQGGR